MGLIGLLTNDSVLREIPDEMLGPYTATEMQSLISRHGRNLPAFLERRSRPTGIKPMLKQDRESQANEVKSG